MKSVLILIGLTIILLQMGCAPNIALMPIDRSQSKFMNFNGLVVFELPQGEEWYILKNDSGIGAFGKKLESNDHTFIASSHISRFTVKHSTPEDFLTFTKQSRIMDTSPYRFKIIKHEESLDQSKSQYCTKFILTAQVIGKGTIESKGYTCLHPTYPELGITIEYSERTKGPRVSEKIRNEGERFINSLKFK